MNVLPIESAFIFDISRATTAKDLRDISQSIESSSLDSDEKQILQDAIREKFAKWNFEADGEVNVFPGGRWNS